MKNTHLRRQVRKHTSQNIYERNHFQLCEPCSRATKDHHTKKDKWSPFHISVNNNDFRYEENAICNHSGSGRGLFWTESQRARMFILLQFNYEVTQSS